MIPGGYILQPRCFDDSDSAHLPPCTREVWYYVLRNVNHADNGRYKRGQAFFRFANIQEALHWYVGNSRRTYSKPQITKALGRLRDETMLETAKATRGIVITILNYDLYQDSGNYEGNAVGKAKETRRFQEGITKNKKLRMKEVKKDLKPFDHFWATYPKKVGKGGALKVWNRLKPDLQTILTALEWQTVSDQWQRGYVPNPATYLNQERWTDEPQAAPTNGQQPPTQDKDYGLDL